MDISRVDLKLNDAARCTIMYINETRRIGVKMSFNRKPVIEDVHFVLCKSGDSFVVQQLILTLEVALAQNVNRVVSYSPSVDDSFDDTHPAPLVFAFSSDDAEQKKLSLSISLHPNHTNLENNLLLELTTDCYKRILTSSLSNEVEQFLPDDLDGILFRVKNNLKIINDKYGHIAKYSSELCLIINDIQGAIRLLVNFMYDDNKIILHADIKKFVKDNQPIFLRYLLIKAQLTEALSALKKDDQVEQIIKENIIIDALSFETDPFDYSQQYFEEIKHHIGRFFSSEQLSRLLKYFNYHENMEEGIYSLLILHLLYAVLQTLSLSSAINENIINRIQVLYQSQTLEDFFQRLQFAAMMLPKMQDCGLLTEASLQKIFSGIQMNIDASSHARLQGMGLENLTGSKTQRRWGYFSMLAEDHLLHQLENNESLSDMIKYAASLRHDIAKTEAKNSNNDDAKKDALHFGEERVTRAVDFYRSEVDKTVKSVIDPKLFPSVITVVSPLISADAKTDHPACGRNDFASFFSTNVNYQYEWEGVSAHNIALPKETIVISIDPNKGICGVTCTFAQVTSEQVNKAIQQLDNIYLKKLQQKPLAADVDPLLLLGELTFHLARLYPFTRGTGAIVKWLTRSILKLHYGKELHKELNDLRIGPDHNIPYDVYSHFVKTPAEYAVVFKASLQPLLPTITASLTNKM